MLGMVVYAIKTTPIIDEESRCLKCGEGEPHYCEACHQIVLAENIKLQVEVEDLKKAKISMEEQIKWYERRISSLNETIDELRSNKNGLLKTIKHLEKQITKTPFPAEKQELAYTYNTLIKTYNCIDDRDLDRKISCRFI